MHLYHAGDEIEIQFDGKPGDVKRAKVRRSASGECEDFQPRAADYMDGWLEISFEDCADPEQREFVMLAGDFHYYLSGSKITLRRL